MSTYVIDGSGRPVIDKDPDAILDYSIDLTDWLSDPVDTISSLLVLTTGVDLDAYSFSGAICTAWVSGGTEGDRAIVTFRFTTTGGRTDDRSIYLKIKSR